MKQYGLSCKYPRKMTLTRSARIVYKDGSKMSKLYDCDVARYAISHMRLIDILNPFKVARAAIASRSLLSSYEVDTFKNLKFKYKFK